MCRILIERVEKEFPPKSGKNAAGTPWKLFIFNCCIGVDGTGKTAIRTVKTFEKRLADKIRVGDQKVFEATREGAQKPYSFLVQSKKPSANNAEPVESLRRFALECASRVVAGTGYIDSMSDESIAEYTITEARKMLTWLEGEVAS